MTRAGAWTLSPRRGQPSAGPKHPVMTAPCAGESLTRHARHRAAPGTACGRLARLCATLAVGLAVLPPAAAEPAARSFDRVTYTAPPGWTVDSSKAGFVSVARVGKADYCMVAIYASTPASGDLAGSFAAEWQAVALRTVDPVGAPAASETTIGGARALLGGTPAAIQGTPVVAMLMVVDAGTRVVPILLLSTSMEAFATYTDDVQRLLGSLVVRRAEAAAPHAPADGDGKLVIPPLTRPLTVAELAGEWKKEDRITTTYVDRHSGAYVGEDNLAFRVTWTITASGAITTDFFGIRNGKKIVEKQVGTIRIATDGVLDLGIGSGRYLIRGWLDLPAMSILKIVGPFDAEIPADVRSNPAKAWNLEQHWVRVKRRTD
jgi:hypothetical protein